jgi:hypothetical protein
MMVPGLALLLVGGLTADRFDALRLLPPLHVIALLPIAVVAYQLHNGTLSYGTMIGYALAMGALAAFVAPARDALLSRVGYGEIQRTVTLQLAASYLGQLGAFALTALEVIPPLGALAIQGASLLAAAASFRAIRPPRPHAGQLAGGSGLREIADALRVTLASTRLRSTLAVQLSIGLLLAGSWMVILQLVVRDVHGGGRGATSLFYGAMMVGTLLGTVSCAWRGGVRRMGVVLLAGLSLSALGSAGLAFSPPLPLTLLAIVLWGAGGAMAMVMTRTISQESAPPSHRARVLSLFQLAVIGGAPFGAYVSGLVAQHLGAAAAALYPAAGLALVILLALTTSNLVRIRAE